MIYYSQNDEERFLCNYFSGFTGRFLDIGAYTGVELSNTRRLLEIGWSGVMVEPSHVNFAKLMSNCKDFSDRVILIQAAVSSERKMTRFWIDETQNRQWASTINTELKCVGSVMSPAVQDVRLFTCTPQDIEPFGPFDFISIDAEWEDYDILMAMPSSMILACRAICIESRGEFERPKITNTLNKLGFLIGHNTPENIIGVR